MKTKLLALLLALSLVLSLGVGLNVSAEDTIVPPTTINFDDDVNPFVAKSSGETSYPQILTLADGTTKAFAITGVQAGNQTGNSGTYFSRDHGLTGYGIPEASWGTNVRPTKVSFDYKIQKNSAELRFYPLFDLDKYGLPKSVLYNYYEVNITTHAESGTMNSKGYQYAALNTYGLALKSIGTESGVTYPNFTDGTTTISDESASTMSTGIQAYTLNDTTYSLSFDPTSTVAGASYDDSTSDNVWHNFTCEYDWDRFATEGILGITVTIKTSNETLTYVDKVKLDPNCGVTILENQGFSFGFGTTVANTFCVDNILVESYDCVTGATYAPESDEPEVTPNYAPVINGATIKREGSQDLRFNCEFGDIREDKEVAEYGLILTFKQYIDNGDVTEADMVADSTNKYVRVIKSSDVENVAKGNEFYANVGNIYPDAYGYRYSARVYVKYNDGTTVDYSDILDRSVISVAKAMSKFAYDKQLAGIGDIVSAIDGDSITWTYDPNTDNGVTILNWIQTNQQAIVDAYNAANQ